MTARMLTGGRLNYAGPPWLYDHKESTVPVFEASRAQKLSRHLHFAPAFCYLCKVLVGPGTPYLGP